MARPEVQDLCPERSGPGARVPARVPVWETTTLAAASPGRRLALRGAIPTEARPTVARPSRRLDFRRGAPPACDFRDRRGAVRCLWPPPDGTLGSMAHRAG